MYILNECTCVQNLARTSNNSLGFKPMMTGIQGSDHIYFTISAVPKCNGDQGITNGTKLAYT